MFRLNRASQRRLLALFLLLYGCCAAALLPRLTLWLDEVLMLIGVRGATLESLASYAARNAGGVPLGYLYSYLSVQALGDSVFAARLPALLFSLVACLGMFVLARRAGVRQAWLAAAVFALLPLQFRYALELRPYSAALAISIWCTIWFLRLIESPGAGRTIVYGLLVLAGVYTQPYTLFVPLAHLIWLLGQPAARRQAAGVAAAIAAACALFVPWFVYASPFWRAEVATEAIQAHYGWREVRLILKELVGLGYLGTALVLFAAGAGLAAIGARGFWLLCVAAPVAGAVAADMALGYFVAVRQTIFVLAPLSLLAARGVERLCASRPRAGAALAAALLLAALYGDARMLVRPREDWQGAARALSEAAREGACIVPVPEDAARFFAVFEPEISGRLCGPRTDSASVIAVGLSPYGSGAALQALQSKLERDGWNQASVKSFNGPRVLLYRQGNSRTRTILLAPSASATSS